MNNSLTLPWPLTELSPNARVHWGRKAKAAKRYKHHCLMACIVGKLKSPVMDGQLHLWIDFHPPSNRRIDGDNALARIKHGIDAISEHLGIDDSMFVFHPSVKEKRTGGAVIVKITTGPDV